MMALETLSFRHKLSLILIVPMVGIVGVILFGASEKWLLAEKMAWLNQLTRLTVQASGLVHELQKERGMSAGFLGGRGASFRDELQAQRVRVDETYARFKESAAAIAMDRFSQEMWRDYRKSQEDLDRIGALRDQVSQLTVGAIEGIDGYSRMIVDLMRMIATLADHSPTARIASLIYNYNNFLQGKEMAGVERAIIAHILTSRQFAPDMYRRFTAAVAEQEVLFRQFRAMANDENRRIHDQIIGDPVFHRAQEMRDAIFGKGYDSTLYVLVRQIFQGMGIRGIYHSVKNLLIRGSLYGFQDDTFDPEEQQRHYKRQFENSYHELEPVIQRIFALSEKELMPGQRQDMETIWSNVQAYRKSLDTIIALQKQGKHLHEIDQDVAAGVKIDDQPADMAMRRFGQFSLNARFDIDPYDWFDAMTRKIDLFKQVDDDLADDLIGHSVELQLETRRDFYLYVLVCVLMIVSALWFGIVLIRQVRNKTARMLDLTRAVQAGNRDARIPIPFAATADELDHVAIGMNEMLDGLARSTRLRDQAEQALRGSEDRFRSVVETAPDAIITMNADGMIEAINPAGSRLFGRATPDDGVMPGQPLHDLVDPASRVALDQALRALHDQPASRHLGEDGGFFCRDLAGATFPATIAMSAWESGDVSFYTLILRDIREQIAKRRQIEQLLDTLDAKVAARTHTLNRKIQELENTRNELIASEKMASLGRLVAGMAHEVNTPIGVALAGASQLHEECRELGRLFELDEVNVHDVMSIVGNMEDASVLVERNLRRAAELIGSFKRASVDHSSEVVREYFVREVVGDVLMSLRNQFKRSPVEVQVDCPVDLRLKGIPGYLNQILTNLLLNSLLHGFAGGSASGSIRIGFASDGAMLRFDYLDTGAGMSEDVRVKAFEPFFTTNRSAGGSGLGLYICYNLITMKLQGEIVLNSAPGAGVHFLCHWPVSFRASALTSANG
ncbi:MAG: nitrate- and nitrite sensing domain-containing protein [Magnetococcales bacterium]|nr:nitrate- and nitrite sensing domain-containing protein [Magnetococcales bacterium]